MKSKSDKRGEAEIRQKEYIDLSKKEKIAKLDKKYGKRLGAKRQREKLEKQ
ncbi:hypothetical protein LCGC14_1756520 [marine sediment metagenome]|uniref:Uncharacterized protein n=1 Tax=marine sediment metagenome TaxID=412755 RepID=A0A0F9H2D5_9ZZZZ